MTRSVRSMAHSVAYTTRTAGGTALSSTGRQSTASASGPGPSSSTPQTAGDISSYALPNIKLNGPQAEEITELIRHYDSLIDARDNNVMLLTSQLESEQRRASMLESELGLALAASSRAEAAHAAELAKVEGDVARVLAERRGLLEKLQGIEVVEDAVREMVVQLKSRVGYDDSPSPEQLQADKEALRGENILTVLGSLRATLKSLWTFKVEAEEDMRCSRTSRQQQHSQQVLGLKAHIREMEAAVRQAVAEQKAAEALAAEETAAREAVLAESREVLAAMEAQQREVLAALRAATEEAAAARRALAAAQDEGRRRDGLVLKNQQLESARHFDRVAQDRELRLMQTAHNRQMAAMQGELTRISDLMVQNDGLRDRLRQALSGQGQLKQQLRTASAHAELASRQQRMSARSQTDTASLAPSASANPHRSAGGAGPGSTTGGGTGLLGRARPATAAALLAARRATAQEQAKAAAEEQEEQDPIYQTLTNVSKLHKGYKGALKQLKRDLADAAPAWLLKEREAAAAAAGGAGGGGGLITR
ncbi:hypothetical protein CHLRE_14g623350v5 [Chlamydomonas reinhardtii]|uniref:Uncharacterized protein n=1 Tax=Chlamydomonas reinhardtii TaxID=3055 RepID=A0A2K3CY58_CHLRE|nr:uncharacterized protein CHLRE_14g623350v5 [Chlamydomonas reinhardtii]PNW73213.1 hypothetical protein CHLRE_14g623350v5 [Chlamydomonas reinhardtii]